MAHPDELGIPLGTLSVVLAMDEEALRRLILAKRKLSIYQRDAQMYEMGYRGNH